MIDLRDLIKGILVVIFFSISIGQFERLHTFAREQAIASLKGWPEYHFFPKGYEGHSIHRKQAKNQKVPAF